MELNFRSWKDMKNAVTFCTLVTADCRFQSIVKVTEYRERHAF